MKPLRVVVIGCGHMGRRHAEKVVALGERDPRVALSAVVDVDLEVAESVASELGTRAASDAGRFVDEADAAIIAVPTVQARPSSHGLPTTRRPKCQRRRPTTNTCESCCADPSTTLPSCAVR